MAFSVPIRQHDSEFSKGADPARRAVLAERYKTKVCMNSVETGACPYEGRCMFAHGDAELRTKGMNLRDGLVTEGAIHKFRRQAARAASMNSAPIHRTPPNNFRRKSTWCASPETASYVRDGALIHDPYGWMAITPRSAEHDANEEICPRDEPQWSGISMP